MLVGGDYNIDRYPPNDPMSRPEIRALNPLLEDLMLSADLQQINFKPTRHQMGNKSSLLDLFLTNIPQRISNIENVLNTTSEHQCVKCVILLKSSIRQSQSFLRRDYSRCSFANMQPLVDSSHKLQSLFSSQDPELISEKLVQGLKEITDHLVEKRRIQKRKRGAQYWCQKLEDEREKVRELNKISIATKDVTDIRSYKNAKNVHSRNSVSKRKWRKSIKDGRRLTV